MTVRNVTVELGQRTRIVEGAFDPYSLTVEAGPADVGGESTAAAVSLTTPPPVVGEAFPDSGTVDRFISATDSQGDLDAIQAGEIVEFAAGSYGDKNLNNLPAGVYAFCRATMGPNGDFGHKWTGTPAFFQHGHDGVCYDHPFAWDLGAGSVLRGFQVRGYSPLPKSGTDHRGSGVIRPAPGGGSCQFMDLEVSHSRESAIMPTGERNSFKRVASHHLGRYMWGAQVGHFFSTDQVWVHDIATDAVQALGLVPEQQSSDEGVCKMSGTNDATILNTFMWDVAGNGIWWDGAAERGVVDEVKARNVDRSVVNMEVDFGPFTITDIYAEDSANASQDGTDVIRAIVLWPLTPHVYVARVTGVRCGNGVTTHNRDHSILDTGGLGFTAAEIRDRLGVVDSLVEDCDLSAIEGGSGRHANRYNAGWAGGQFTHSSGDVIPFDPPVWRNNQYSPNAQFRAGNDFPFGLSRWQSTYGMS